MGRPSRRGRGTEEIHDLDLDLYGRHTAVPVDVFERELGLKAQRGRRSGALWSFKRLSRGYVTRTPHGPPAGARTSTRRHCAVPCAAAALRELCGRVEKKETREALRAGFLEARHGSARGPMPQAEAVDGHLQATISPDLLPSPPSEREPDPSSTPSHDRVPEPELEPEPETEPEPEPSPSLNDEIPGRSRDEIRQIIGLRPSEEAALVAEIESIVEGRTDVPLLKLGAF